MRWKVGMCVDSNSEWMKGKGGASIRCWPSKWIKHIRSSEYFWSHVHLHLASVFAAVCPKNCSQNFEDHVGRIDLWTTFRPSRLSLTVWANLGSFCQHWPKNLVAQHSPQNSVSNLFGMGHPVVFMLIDGDFQERKKQASKRHRCWAALWDGWSMKAIEEEGRLQAGPPRAISSTFLPPIPDPSTDRSQFPPPSNSATAHGSLADLRLSRPIKQILETFRFCLSGKP